MKGNGYTVKVYYKPSLLIFNFHKKRKTITNHFDYFIDEQLYSICTSIYHSVVLQMSQFHIKMKRNKYTVEVYYKPSLLIFNFMNAEN